MDVPNSFVSPYNDSFVSFVSQSGWWCPALWMSRLHLSSHIKIHLSQLSPSLAGGVHLSPKLPGGVRLSGFICLPIWLVVCSFLAASNSFATRYFPLQEFICLPVWLVGPSLRLSRINSFVSAYRITFVSQSGWWCPALSLSPIHLPPLNSL